MDPALLISIVINAAVGLWAFYNSKWWPAQQKERESGQEFDRKTRGDALTQVLDANKALIDNLIERSKVEYKVDAAETNLVRLIESVKSEVAEVRRGMVQINTREQLSAKDRERMEEVLGDVDVMFHEIKAMLTAKGAVAQ